MLLRAWRLTGPPSLRLQRLSRRVVGGAAAVRFLAADPGPSSALRGFWDEWSSMLFGQGRTVTPQQGDSDGAGGGGDGQGRPPIEPAEQNSELHAEQNSELHALLEAGERSKALEMFDRLLDQGQVSEHDLVGMMKMCLHTSAEMRKLSSRVEQTGVPITALTFNRLLSSQLIEGHADEAEALLHLMARRGIEHDEHTAAVLARTQERLSKRRMWLLVRMLKEGEASRAWELYDRLLKLGCTDEYHLAAMMRACPGSEEQRALVTRAERAGVETTAHTYTRLLSRLRVEGRMEEAEELQREMARRGIEPNEYTDRVLKTTATELSRHRSSVLGRLLAAGETAKAWELFDGLLERGHADEHALTNMLKACPGSEEQRALVSRAEQAGLEPDTFTFNLLFGKLYVEGRTEEAEALHRDMVQRGVAPDEYTAKLLGEDPEEVLSKQHTVQLWRLWKAGKKAKAWELFDGLLERGHADEYHLTTMLKGCPSSEEQRMLVQRAKEAGVATTLPTYNLLLGQLRYEGRSEEAEALQRDMAQRGIEPNESTAKTMSRAAELHGKMRTAELVRLLEAGETAKAWELFDGLLGRGHANEHHLTVMLKTGLSMDEQRALVQRAEEADVAMGVSTYTLLLSSARVEGRMEEAEALQQVMARRGIEPNDYTAKVMARSSEVLAKQRTSELGRLLREGETSRAWELFDSLLERGRAGEYHLTTMLKACHDCEQMVELVTRAEQAGVRTAAPTFTLLLSNALFEGRTKDMAALQREMARRGIEPDSFTADVLSRTPEVLSRQRTAKLVQLLKAGERSRAWALFDGLLERGHADAIQYNVMMAACTTAAEKQFLEQRSTKNKLVRTRRKQRKK